MLSLRTKLIALALVGALALAACSDDEGAGNNGSNNGGEPDATAADTSEADVGVDVGEDVGQDTSQDDVSTPDPLRIPDFTYSKSDESCAVGSCVDGVGVNIISGRVTKIENGDSRPTDIDESEVTVDEVEAKISTEQIQQKMLDGWDCGDATEANGAEWSFSARVLREDGTYGTGEVVQNISGCVPADSTQPDATLVQDLISFLDNVRDVSFDNQ